MIISIPHESYPLPSLFTQNPMTQVQSFQVSAIYANLWNTSAQTIPITVVSPVDKLPQDIQTTSVLSFIAPTVSSMVTPTFSAPAPCSPIMTPSWTQPGISPTTRSMRKIEALEMKLQDCKEGNVMDIWDLPPFSSLPPSPSSHSLWNMIMNDEGISLEIWDQFIGSDVLSITF